MLPNVLVALTLLATIPGASFDASRVAARVNGVPIREERVERYFEGYLKEKGRNVAAIRSPSAYDRLRREALDELIDQELLWQEAQRRRLVASKADVEAALADLRAAFATREELRQRLDRAGFTEESYAETLRQQLSIQRLVKEEITSRLSVKEAEVRAYYEEHRASFTRPEQIRARHVLVKVAPTASAEEKARARGRIEAILAEARAGAPFPDLARRRSEDATAAEGGDLGFFARGQMVGPFEEAAFALQPGELSGVVETVFGFHVIQVEDRRAEERIPEAAVREKIRAQLADRKAKGALAERVRALREHGRIEVAGS